MIVSQRKVNTLNFVLTTSTTFAAYGTGKKAAHGEPGPRSLRYAAMQQRELHTITTTREAAFAGHAPIATKAERMDSNRVPFDA